MKILSILTVVCLAALCVVQAEPVPEEILNAVKEVAAADGLHPRRPHYLLEQFVPTATADEERRQQMAWALLEAFLAKTTTSSGRTILAQHLAKVAGDAEHKALRSVRGDAPMMADARIALNDLAASSIKDEGRERYLAEIATGKPEAMIAGLSALAMFHPADAVAVARRHIGDNDAQMAATALRIMAKRDAPGFVKSIAALNRNGQILALAIVGEFRIDKARDVALELAGSADADLREAAIAALGSVGDSACVGTLLAAGAVDALAALDARGVEQAILAGISKGDSLSRMTALKAAVQRGIPDSDGALLAAAAGNDSEVAIEALKVLGRSGDTANYPRLVALLGGALSEEVETAVRRMIKRMDAMDHCLTPLSKRLDEKEVAVITAVLRSLSAIDTADALALVEKHLTAEDGDIRDTAVRALAQWADPAALPLLKRVAADDTAGMVHRTLCERAIARFSASGARLSALAYLNCGVDTRAKGKSGVELTVTRGKPWKFTDDPAGMVVFDGSEIVIEAKGLDPQKRYQLGFVWWDYDNNGREQSVVIGKMRVLAKTALPAWKEKKQPAQTIAVNVPASEISGEGACVIRIVQSGSANCVLSEIWIAEGEVSGSPAPVPVTAAAPAVAAPAKPSAPQQFGPPVVKANRGAQKKVLVVTGLEYPGHPWRETAPEIVKLLSEEKRLEVSYTEDYTILSRREIFSYDTVFLNYQNHGESAPEGALANLTRYVTEGGGLTLFHFACGAFIGHPGNGYNPEFVTIAGRVWNPKLRGHDPFGKFTVAIADRDHPITSGMTDFEIEDELYTCLDGDAPIHLLATAVSRVDQKVYPMAFTLNPGKGRTFHCVLGHNLKAFNEPMKALFRRGTAWAAGL